MSKARNRQYLENIFRMLVFQGGSFFARLVIVPLSLGYLDPTRYGLWLVISSVFSSLSVLDLGLGNGLRNKLSKSLTLKDFDLARKYVSTTYFFVTMISIGLLSLFFILHQFVNWANVLNAPTDLASEFNQVIILCFTFFSFNFIFNLIISILTADQHIGLSRIYDFTSNILVLVTIYLLKTFTHSSFLFLCMAMVIPQLIVLLGMNAYLFITKYRRIYPSIACIQISLGKDLMGLGIKFFISAVATMIVLTTDNIIITTLFGPEEVTPYNIAYQYMTIGFFLFNIILAPSWSAYTEAHTLNDKDWIIKTLFRIIGMWVVFLLVLFVFVLISQPVYTLWVGSEIVIPKSLTMLMAVFAAQTSFNSIFSHYIFGVGKIDLLVLVGIIAGILNIPLSVFLARECGMGTQGVILATIICSSFGFVLLPIQTYFLIHEKAKGIWNR